MRIDLDHAIVFMDEDTRKERAIHAGTPVGSTSVLIHDNENIFPKSRKFCPEHWLGGEGRELKRYPMKVCVGSQK